MEYLISFFEMPFIRMIGAILIVMGIVSLLMLQYIMVITDIFKNRAKPWEIVVGLIPLGPYILMILTAIVLFIKVVFSKRNL